MYIQNTRNVYTKYYTLYIQMYILLTMSKKYLLYIHHPNFSSEKRKSDLVNRLLDNHYNATTGQTQPTLNVYTTSLSSPVARTEQTRTKQHVLQDIEQEKQILQELLEVNQDPADHARQQSKIQELWDEYHLLVKEEDNNELL